MMASQNIGTSNPKQRHQGSPKLNLNSQNQETSPKGIGAFQKLSLSKIQQRDGQKSPSPEDQRGARDIIQRIQMKNLAFMPASAASQNQQSLVPSQQQSKTSPQRQHMGGAIIIPVNQIKLVKKDNASPSPESRLPTKTQLSPKSFIFPQKSDPQNQIRKTQSKVQINTNQLSDDETNVNSDNEERASQLSQIKPNQSNFNRPKLQSNHQPTFQDSTLQNQRTSRGSALQNLNGGNESQRMKVINPNKIKNSPSPVTLLQKKEEGPNSKQQTLLASDFIKGMINQSRTNNNLLNQNTSQKKIMGIIRNNGQPQQLSIKSKENVDQQKSDHSKFLEENKEQPQKILIKKIQHVRNYSPPPTFDIDKQNQMMGIVIKDCKTTNKQPEVLEQQEQKKENGDQGNIFQFPFQ